jgi:hypothetical protein
MLPWRKLEEEAACSSSTTNKCVLPSDQVEPATSLVLPSHHGGGGELGIRLDSDLFGSGGWGDVVTAYTAGSASSTASRQSRAGPPSTLMAGRRPLPTCTPLSNLWCKVTLNLQAMPIRRPFNSGAISSRCSDPSGHVPGVAVVVRGRNFCEQGGEGAGPGHDCFLCFTSEVLYAICQDLVVIYFFLEVLYVSRFSTALY